MGEVASPGRRGTKKRRATGVRRRALKDAMPDVQSPEDLKQADPLEEVTAESDEEDD